MQDLVSIITPSYNTAGYIARTIRSVKAQTYKNWEMIIVDDCSADETDAIVEPFLSDDRIIYLKNSKNCGAAVCRNRAIKRAKGRWIAFLDSDDLWKPSKLEEQIRFMEQNKIYFSYTNYEEMDENSHATGVFVSGPRKISRRMMHWYCWPGCLTVMYDADYIGTVQIKDIKKNNDYAMWLFICRKADCHLLNKNLAAYRKRAGSISNQKYGKLIKWHYKLWKEAQGRGKAGSLWFTMVNLAFGFLKKRIYVKRNSRRRAVYMDREGRLYKIRRKLQTMAFQVAPHETLSRLYCRIYLHKNINIKDPRTLNEKLQWLKLYEYPKNPLVIQGADKYAARRYVEEKGYGQILTALLGVWEKAEQINWDTLPEKFVLKCTHGCAYNILCRDKGSFDKKEAARRLNKWLKEDFSAFNLELHYGKIKPRRIICEEYLGDVIVDYKFFCFHGEPRFFYVSSDLAHDRQAKMGFFEMDGSKIPLLREDYEDIGTIRPPACLPEMTEAARVLSKDFLFVRVDFFLLGNTFRFAELTFTPAAGMMPIDPEKYDWEWGNMLDLSEVINRRKKR